MSLRWKYLVVVLATVVATAAARLVLAACGVAVHPVVAAAATLAAVTAVLLASYRSFVASPLLRIVEGAERVAEGDRSHRIDLPAGDEMATIALSINHLAERVAKAHTELETQVAERTADLRAVLAEVHERSRIVEEVNEQLAEVDRRRAEFLTNVSHELRTPLNSILGFLRLLLDGMYENERERGEFLENARLAASHMQHLVTNVLSATQIEAGRVKLRVEPFHPGDVVHEVLRIMEVLAREKDIAIRLEVEGRAMACADVGQVRQVLVNLVGNAIKYTERGEIVVRTRAEDGHVRFVVEDTGVGIPPDELERIFTRFHQVSAPTQRWSGGTGLGLSIAREMVRLMGGRIGAHSDGPGRGARIEFTVPAAQPSDAALGAKAAPDAMAP